MSGIEELKVALPARIYRDIADRAAVEGISVDEQIRRLLGQGMDSTVNLKRGTVVKANFSGPQRP